MTDIVQALRGELMDCNCAAHGRCECCCDTVWPEDVARQAADEIERLTNALHGKAEALMMQTNEIERLRKERDTLELICEDQRKLYSNCVKIANELDALKGKIEALQPVGYTLTGDELVSYTEGYEKWNPTPLYNLDQLRDQLRDSMTGVTDYMK